MAKKTIDHTEDYQILEFLGSGAYGAVFSARDLFDKSYVAIKSSKDLLSSRTMAKRTLRELRILRHCDHPNIVKLLRVIPPKDAEHLTELNFVFEIMDTDLSQVIKSPQPLLVDHVQYFAVQLASALDYLHRARVIHRDVKPRNILVNADCTLKLADFGLAKLCPDGVVSSSSANITDYVTTRWYRAPEVLTGWTQYGAAIDMWAVGCIIAELFQRVPVFPGSDSAKQVELIIGTLGFPDSKFLSSCKRSSRRNVMKLAEVAPLRSNLRLKFGRIPSDAFDLISRLLILDPSRRLSAAECLDHRFLSNTSYPRLDDLHLQIPASCFRYEEVNYTIEGVRQELINEVTVHNPFWNQGLPEENLGSAGTQEDSFMDGLVPEMNISSDIEEDSSRDDFLGKRISLPAAAAAAASFHSLTGLSDSPIAPLGQSIEDQLVQEAKSAVRPRAESNMSKDTLVEGFMLPREDSTSLDWLRQRSTTAEDIASSGGAPKPTGTDDFTFKPIDQADSIRSKSTGSQEVPTQRSAITSAPVSDASACQPLCSFQSGEVADVSDASSSTSDADDLFFGGRCKLRPHSSQKLNKKENPWNQLHPEMQRSGSCVVS